MKKILVFGGGENQKSLIKTAERIGVQTIVIDPNADVPGKNFASYFHVVKAHDLPGTIEIANKYKVDGIITSQMENPLLLMAEVAEHFNFAFPHKEVIEKCRNKFLMKLSWQKANIPCARGIVMPVHSKFILMQYEHLHFPLMLKPLDAFSSRGVFKVNNVEELEYNLEGARKFSSTQEIIIEEFIEGPEFSVESITYQGQTTLFQITEKEITPYPHTVEMAHIQPANITLEEKQSIIEIVKKSIHALGLNNSASHAELKLTKDGPKMIEIGARLGGYFISSYLTNISTGLSLEEAAIKTALRIEPQTNPLQSHGSAIRYLNLPYGKTIKSIGNWKNIIQGDVVYANIYPQSGDVISSITDSSKRQGFVIVKGVDYHDAKAKSWKYHDELAKFITFK